MTAQSSLWVPDDEVGTPERAPAQPKNTSMAALDQTGCSEVSQGVLAEVLGS